MLINMNLCGNRHFDRNRQIYHDQPVLAKTRIFSANQKGLKEESLVANIEEGRRDILLIVITALFILFATGLAVPEPTPRTPIVIP